ncbi:MAG: rod shape-determining protein MreD [Gammaproteobacteria bacterium]|nr:rod shape-determining protein MreD [Gammaproteobacteria bacterium]
MSDHGHHSRQWPLWTSLLVAVLFTLTPAPDWYGTLFPDINLRPIWLLPVCFYWAIALPQRFSVGSAWLFGLLLDVTSGGLLGRHTIGLVISVWIAQRFYLQLRQFPFGQQAIVVGLLAMLQQLLLLWIDGATGVLSKPMHYFTPVITTMMLWPLLFPLLRKLRISLHVR